MSKQTEKTLTQVYEGLARNAKGLAWFAMVFGPAVGVYGVTLIVLWALGALTVLYLVLGVVWIGIGAAWFMVGRSWKSTAKVYSEIADTYKEIDR
jgi:hypothetical protein